MEKKVMQPSVITGDLETLASLFLGGDGDVELFG